MEAWSLLSFFLYLTEFESLLGKQGVCVDVEGNDELVVPLHDLDRQLGEVLVQVILLLEDEYPLPEVDVSQIQHARVEVLLFPQAQVELLEPCDLVRQHHCGC